VTNQKILIAEDNQINLDFLSEKLADSGFTVQKAVDGIDALVKLKSFIPDIILMDNLMPRMTGMELVAVLKKDQHYRDIPIVMFSAIDDAQEKIKGFSLGIHDYLVKPLNFSKILECLLGALNQRDK